VGATSIFTEAVFPHIFLMQQKDTAAPQYEIEEFVSVIINYCITGSPKKIPDPVIRQHKI
jgi:hypothetical protein